MGTSLILTMAQINPVVGDLSFNLELIRNAWKQTPPNSDLIVFPELSLTGYMPEDLLLNSAFLDNVEKVTSQLVEESTHRHQAILIGAPYRDGGRLYNAAILIHDGQVAGVCYKHELPNYGVFDEKRYFVAGGLPDPLPFKGVNLGVMICEDMWFPQVSSSLKAKGADLLVVLNGSPYHVGQHQERLHHASLRVKSTGLPLIYVNQVGGQDDLVYDGASFMMRADGTITLQCPEFLESCEDITLERGSTGIWLSSTETIHALSMETAAIYQAAVLGLRDYMRKSGMTDVLIGMSGGIDSALSAAMAVDALGANHVRCLMLASPYTSAESFSDARDCAERLGAAYEDISLTPLLGGYQSLDPGVEGLAHENLQSRLRGVILMTRSNQSGAMVLSTGNKSEMATGYATLYGDMCGGYNCLKDIYKTRVYALAIWRNSARPPGGLGPVGEVINQSILTKAPTAELKPGQKDQDTLPPYDELDRILACLLEEDLGIEETVARGHAPEIVRKVQRMVTLAEYKRRQSPPGPRISPRAFTRERRYPIVNGYGAILPTR